MSVQKSFKQLKIYLTNESCSDGCKMNFLNRKYYRKIQSKCYIGNETVYVNR